MERRILGGRRNNNFNSYQIRLHDHPLGVTCRITHTSKSTIFRARNVTDTVQDSRNILCPCTGSCRSNVAVHDQVDPHSILTHNHGLVVCTD